MTFDPGKPSFTGKLQLQTTNATGQKFYMSYTAKAGLTLPTLSSIRVADRDTIWTTYDAGSGSVFLVSNAGLYFSVQSGNNVAILVPDAGAASPVRLIPGIVAGQVQITWVDPALAKTLTGYYQLGTGLPATLTFLESGGSDVLAALGQTVTTPGLAAMQSSKSAAGYDLTGVNLTGANLAGIDCTGAHFDQAILDGTIVSGATLTRASFTGVNLTGVVWGNDVSAANADFSNTIGVGMVVPSTGTSGHRATFDSATFTGADWAGCDLTNASLHGAFVTGANFCGATLTSAYLYALQAGKSNDGTVPGADFSYAYMPDVNLQASNLNGANLSHAQVYFLNVGASLLNANMTEADCSAADFSGASFGGLATSIAGTNFENAVLFDANFNGVTLGLSASGTPVSMVGAWLENATFTNVLFSGVRMSGARVAVSAGPAGSGVPLFAISSDLAGYVAALDLSQLPSAFAGPSGLFASAGCALSSTATVSVVSAGQCWTLTQPPTRTTPGVEDVVFSLVLAAGVLDVYTSGISLTEQGDGGITYAAPYTVAATALPPASLGADTRCPNHATKGTNDALWLSWREMMTAPRLSLVVLDAGTLASGPAANPAPSRRCRRGGPFYES
jgi:uncharacterized protein YjbI with pentapeptide repeats